MSKILPLPLSLNQASSISQKKGLLLKDFLLPKQRDKLLKIVTDNRQLMRTSTFLCYKGVHSDSHTFLENAQHARAFIIENPAFLKEAEKKGGLLVKNARAAWSLLSAELYGNPQKKLKFIGITGTNGKTSICFLTQQILTHQKISCASLGTLGFFMQGKLVPGSQTTPDPPTLFKHLAKAVQAKCKVIVMEASSHAMSQDRLFPLFFDACCFSSFSRDHLDFHKTKKAYFAAKKKLFTDHLKKDGLALINNQIPLNEFASLRQKTKLLSYGQAEKRQTKPDPSVYYELGSTSLLASNVTVYFQEQQSQGVLPFCGKHTLENFLAAYLLSFHISKKRFSPKNWQNLLAPPGRLELVRHKNYRKGPFVYVDYAHTPDALDKVLTTLMPFCQGQLWIIFGCGGNRDQGKRPLMAKICEKFAAKVVLTNDNPRLEDPKAIVEEIKGGFSEKFIFDVVFDRRLAIEKAVSQSLTNDIIVIVGKGHENYQIFANTTVPFSDYQVAKAALQERYRK